MTKKTAKNKSIRYEKNPFLDELVINTKSKSVKISTLGKEDNILVNQTTGEVRGTHVVSYRQVDPDKFVKVFAENIALTFDLTAAGIKAFNVLMFSVMEKAIGRDEVLLDIYTLEEFLNINKRIKNFSAPTFHRGLKELENAKIIAKTKRKGWYFINPSFVFNGDRIAFSTIIERKKSNEPSNNQEQQLDIEDQINKGSDK